MQGEGYDPVIAAIGGHALPEVISGAFLNRIGSLADGLQFLALERGALRGGSCMTGYVYQ